MLFSSPCSGIFFYFIYPSEEELEELSFRPLVRGYFFIVKKAFPDRKDLLVRFRPLVRGYFFIPVSGIAYGIVIPIDIFGATLKQTFFV